MQSQETPPQPRLRLTEARLNRSLSQQDVAESIQTTHVNVSRWERGITKPSPYFRRKLSRLFGMSEEELDLIPAAPMATPAADEENGTGESASRGNAGKSVAAESLPVNTDLPPIYDPAIPLGLQNPLIGREEELKKIKERLQEGGSVALTALNGLPGVGKTALSITLAHDPEIRQHFKDGILWAGLGLKPNMPGLLSRWGTLLGISANQMTSLSNNEAWAKAIRNAIGTRRMLLVLDDAWELEEALMVRVGGPNCSHLVTTRFPNIAAHMTIGGATIIKELGEEESIRLLRQLAPLAVDREAQKVHDLVQAVGGLPLALTLMGNYLRKQASSGPARRISAALERLSNVETRLQIEEPHVPAETHPSLSVDIPLSLQSVIAVTDQRLDKGARAALYALAVFPPKPNTFSEEAALVVAACTIEDLDALSDSGLLEINGGERYQLHQIIADYARINLKDKDLEAAQGRLVEYVVDYVEEHKKDYEQLELESGTILATLEMAYELKKQAELVHIVNAFTPFLIPRGFYLQAVQHLERAKEASVSIKDDYGLTGALLYLGEVAQKQGNYDQAKVFLQEGLDLATKIGVQERICSLLTELGEVEQRQSNYSQAETYFQRGLNIAHQIEDNEHICELLNDLGWVAVRRGESTQAESYLNAGLSIARQIDNKERTIGILQTLGSLANNRGDYVQSEVYLREGLALARRIGDREQLCGSLLNLGVAVGEKGNYLQAEVYFQEGLALAHQIGHRELTSILLANLGEIVGTQKRYTEAEVYFQEGLVLVRQIGHREWISALLTNLGLMKRKQGNYSQAQEYLQESLTLAQQIGRPQVTATALNEYGVLLLDQQHLEAAEAIFLEALKTIPEGSQDLFALAHYGLARIEAGKNNIDEAIRIGNLSATILETMEHRQAKEIRDWLQTLKKV